MLLLLALVHLLLLGLGRILLVLGHLPVAFMQIMPRVGTLISAPGTAFGMPSGASPAAPYSSPGHGQA